MEKIDPFLVLIQPSKEIPGDGHLYFVLNGIKFEHDSDYNLLRLIDDLISSFSEKNRNNYSELLFNLNKKDIVNLRHCYDELLNIEDFPYLKKYQVEFEENLDSFFLYLGLYTFDSIFVVYVRSDKGERLIFSNEMDKYEDAYFEHGGILKHLEKTKLEIMEKFNPKYTPSLIVVPFMEKSIEVNWKLSDHYDYIYHGTTDSKFFAHITPSQYIDKYMWIIFHQESGFNQGGGLASSVEDAKRAFSNWLVENMDTWVVSNPKEKK
jgi:hypothetical protein